MESYVNATAQLGGSFAFGTTLIEPILTDRRETLLTYFAMDADHQRPYDILYKDFVITIIMTKNCGYDTLRKWLAQQHMSPNAQAYPTSTNELVNMMNSGNFEPDPFKSKSKSKRNNWNKNKNKNKDEKEEEVVGAIVEPTVLIPDTPTNDEQDLTDDDTPVMDESRPVKEDVPDSDSDESTNNDSVTDSKGDKSIEDDDEEADIRRVFTLVHSGFNEDDDRFDPEAEEEKYYADCNEAINDNEIVRCVAAEPTYADDEYDHVNHTNARFNGCRALWPGGGPMPHEKGEVEVFYFTGSNFGGNNLGFNMNPGRERPEVARRWQEDQHQMYHVT